jgi:hypothetical protein
VRERRTLGSVSPKAEWLVSTPGQNYITGRSKSTSVRDTLPNQVVRSGRVKPSLLTTKSNSAYGIQARSPFPRS